MNTTEDLFFGELLQQLRKSKKMNQKQLAERIGVSRETISFWERGEYKPEIDTILYEIVRVLGLTEQEQQQLFEKYTVTALAVSFHNPPLERNPYFTGRSPQLTNLHTLLMAGKQVALTQAISQAISGLGGIGKTQLALEYAYRYQKSYHDIFWVTADTYDSLITSYVRLAAILHLPEYDEQDQSKVKAAVQRWLSGHKGWLLILDNIEDLSLVHQFVPVDRLDRQGAVLLTTRRHVTEPVAQALELELLPENDAILFLLKRTKVLAVDMSFGDASDRDIVAARAITQLLGNLPLALDQAGAYILETQCSFADYLALFNTYQAQLLQRRIGEGIPTDHPESVTATFRLNFQQVQQRSEVAGELLRVCAFLASDGIAEEIFVKGASTLGTILQPLSSDASLLNHAIEVLSTFSLIRRDSKEKTLTIHRLVQAVLKEVMDEAERHRWIERVVSALNAAFPHVVHDTWPQCERLLSHALLAAQYIETDHNISEEAGHLLNEMASYLQGRARYTEAEPLYLRALAIREQQLGPQHPQVADSLNKLGVLFYAQGRHVEAEPLYLRALAITEQQLGPEHSQVADSLYNLGFLYYVQGKYAEAEPLYRRALAIREQQLGPQHLRVAALLNSMGFLFYLQAKYAEAESVYLRALAIREQQLGPQHPLVAYSLNNFGSLYRKLGRHAEAESVYLRALAIREQQLGPQHPQLCYPLRGLATLYRKQGKYAEAESFYLRSLAIGEQQLEPKQPQPYELHGLAHLYFAQGQYEKAKPLYQRALNIREQYLGPQHPETAEFLHDFAYFQEMQGSTLEALSLYQRALAIRERVLGLRHPKTRETQQCLLPVLRELGRQKEAASLQAMLSESSKVEEKC